MGTQKCTEGKHHSLTGQGQGGDDEIAFRLCISLCRDLHQPENGSCKVV
ncbi:hypothetical protein EVA_14420 [gut metagenome]|uniref:Uncharacterized protein n=1 Tax=gut metagenome TaxID=749906 RepID=J9FSJ5_9ZZZZ